jgi:Zn-dependent protease
VFRGFGKGWRIGSIGGVPIFLDPSWLWFALPLTYSFYARFSHAPGLDGLGVAGYAVLGAALFLGSVLVHELAHAGTGRALGLPVAGITLLFWGGATDVRAERRGPGSEFLVAAAGPTSSMLLGLLLRALGREVGFSNVALAELLLDVGWVNLVLAVLNALPGLPLDGGRALRAGVWKATGSRRGATEVAGWIGIAVGVALGAFGAYVTATEGNLGRGLWLIFIAMFLVQGARAMREQETMRASLAEGRVRDAMGSPPPPIDAAASLSEALESHLRGHERTAFPVTESGRIVGVLTYESARRIGMRDPLRPVRDAMLPLDDSLTIGLDEPLDSAMDRLSGGTSLLVMQNGVVAGRLSAGTVSRWAAARPQTPTA